MTPLSGRGAAAGSTGTVLLSTATLPRPFRSRCPCRQYSAAAGWPWSATGTKYRCRSWRTCTGQDTAACPRAVSYRLAALRPRALRKNSVSGPATAESNIAGSMLASSLTEAGSDRPSPYRGVAPVPISKSTAEGVQERDTATGWPHRLAGGGRMVERGSNIAFEPTELVNQ
jgi:hypothetical protein